MEILHYLVKHLFLGVEAFVFRCICALLLPACSGPVAFRIRFESRASPQLASGLAGPVLPLLLHPKASGPWKRAVCLQVLCVNRQVAYIARSKNTIASIYSLPAILYI